VKTYPRYAVTAASVFTGRTTLSDGAVLVEDSRIEWVGPQSELPPSVATHALPEGTWLAPGFIDAQVNGGGDVLFTAEATTSTLLRMAAAHRTFGTTSMLPTVISTTRETMVAALEAVRITSHESGILGIHLEGPFLSPQRPGVHNPDKLRSPSEEDFELLTSLSERATLVTLAPECVPLRFIAALAEAGVRVSLGHSMATYDQTRQALGAGLTGFTHLFNAMRPLASREPGPIAAALETANVWFGIIVDGVHVDPAMLRLALRGRAQAMLVTDAMPPVGGQSPYFALNGEEMEARGHACRRKDGVLAGTALDMASAVRNCVRLLGMPLPTALGLASTEPARFLGVDDRLGYLAPEYRADMVALEPVEVRVLGTWLAGSWQASKPIAMSTS
jgi:N-acetylglucosamine-6-phosphate deacetylase